MANEEQHTVIEDLYIDQTDTETGVSQMSDEQSNQTTTEDHFDSDMANENQVLVTFGSSF